MGRIPWVESRGGHNTPMIIHGGGERQRVGMVPQFPRAAAGRSCFFADAGASSALAEPGEEG